MDVPSRPPAQSSVQLFSELTRTRPSFEHQCLVVLAALSIPLRRTAFAKTLQRMGVTPATEDDAAAAAPALAQRKPRPRLTPNDGAVSTQQLQRMLERWDRLGWSNQRTASSAVEAGPLTPH